ncbi:DUF2255 family protein [Allobranchiibius sp. CTAmp26]|uniref:DUF2255 family protein n=1 Tax=Allobranchiibius sp. CTAmp26 TaxID=2815214 RepID=UPI001AA179BB|nr:DUF2255 family protein [Allobranchiibius sp. CTAmp26]MBO1753635.1 DUF2255 family protein [Allobranchiibius sp. CTAmp26]
MTSSWSAQELGSIAAADELQIAVKRADGTLRRWVTIWVVRAGDHVYVRTWYRRDTGWFGHATRSLKGRIRVPGVEVDVRIEDVGFGGDDLRAHIDAAYRAKYGGGSDDRMVGDEAAAATLRLVPDRS